MGEWSDSFEAQMLLSMQRDAEEEMCQEDAKNTIAEENAINYQDHYDDSFDASWSTYRNPPTMRHQVREQVFLLQYSAMLCFCIHAWPFFTCFRFSVEHLINDVLCQFRFLAATTTCCAALRSTHLALCVLLFPHIAAM